MSRAVTAAALLVPVLAAAGCGQSADRDRVRDVTRTFLAAYRAGDGALACAQLSAVTVTALQQQEGSACARAVTRLKLAGGAVTGVEVFVTSARVDLASGESAFLSQGHAGWRLSAVGCRPQGDPTREPFDCAAED